MTVKEFSKKYDLDYGIVYNATWLIKSQTNSLRYKEYDEDELRQAVRKIQEKKIQRMEKEMSRSKEIIAKVL